MSGQSVTRTIPAIRAFSGIISNVIAPYFAEHRVVEVAQAGPLPMIPMGIYVLAERPGEKRLEALLAALMAASHEKLPLPRD